MALITDLITELNAADLPTRQAFAEALNPNLKQDRLRREKDALISEVVAVGKQAIDDLIASVSTQIETDPDRAVLPDAKAIGDTFIRAIGL